VGGAKYNGLLLDVRKRAARGITVSSNYTWSHCVASERDDLNGFLLSPGATYIRVGDRERRSEEHTSELQSRFDLVCRLLLEKKKQDRCRLNDVLPISTHSFSCPHVHSPL